MNATADEAHYRPHPERSFSGGSHAGSSIVEPFASRWQRRVRTIPMMLGITVAGVLASPFILVAAVTVDVARRRFRLPTARVALFLLQYAINDSIEIVLTPLYWMVAGFGSRLDQPRSVRRHERLQQWSVAVLARRAQQLLGLRLAIDPGTESALAPGPVIALSRHVNIVDASLPTLLYQRLGFRTRSVIMAELLADPGFDLIYGRTGSVFIPRDNGHEARSMLSRLGVEADASTAVVIFPEGRLFRPERLQRTMARLGAENIQRAARLATLTSTLPPRPGGVLALLDAMPGTDVVVIAHAGLDRFASFSDLARAVPLRDPICVVAWRIPADLIPTSVADRIRWLDEQWVRLDDWVKLHSPA